MHRKSYCAALAVVAVVVSSVAYRAKADTTAALESGTGTLSFKDGEFTLTGGNAYDPISLDSLFTFDLDLALGAGAVTTPFDTFGDTEVTGPFTGTYTLYEGGSAVSSGTASAQGDFLDLSAAYGFIVPPTFTDGLLTQTTGSGLDIYPGVTQFNFTTSIGEGFTGTLGPAVSTVPLPASAAMGTALLTILGITSIARRRRAQNCFCNLALNRRNGG